MPRIDEKDLLPCPFCGSKAHYHRDIDGCTYISCRGKDCYCTMRVDWNPEMWQRRTNGVANNVINPTAPQ